MIGRLRNRFGSPASGTGNIPSVGEAMAAWALGTAWALCCLWLWRIGPGELVPLALLSALLTLWGWRSVRWLYWFPTVAVVASLLDLAAPVAPEAAPGGLGYVGMIAFAAVLLAIARMLALGRVPIAGRPREVSVALLGALGTGLALATGGGTVRSTAVGLVAFGAGLAMAARPTGERRVWVAFPFTTLLIALHAIVVFARFPGELLEQSMAADLQWGVPHALLQLLILTLPVTAALAIDAGVLLRRFSRVALVLGVIALGLRLYGGLGPSMPPVTNLAGFVHAPGATVVAVATLMFLALAVGWLGFSGGIARPRWIGLAVSLAIASVLLVWSRLLVAETAQVLLAFGMALAAAVRTAERRARALGLARADWPLAVRTRAGRRAAAAAPDPALVVPIAAASAPAPVDDDVEQTVGRAA